MTPVAAATERIIIAAGWRSGTPLENVVAHWLHRGGWKPGQITQQHRVDSYRIDFAWADLFLALEVDGWHHRSPEGAAHDALRDSHLRRHGWIVLRVDDRNGEESLIEQVINVSRLAHVMSKNKG